MDDIQQKKRVLLVEDNADDEHLTLRGLKKCRTPPEVQIARDGSQAVEILANITDRKELPDLVLLDLKLPKLSGIEVLKRIRANAMTQAVPVVVLTSSDEESDVRVCYSSGANSYVCKPVDYQEFLRAVCAIGEFWFTVNRLPIRSRNAQTSVASA